MKKVTITLPSVTYAIKLRKKLGAVNINSKLVKLDTQKSGGCEYGVEFAENYLLDVVSLVKEENIVYSVYNGEKEK